MKEKGLNIKTIKTNMRTSLTKIKKISVDMTQRLQKSFGTPVLQQGSQNDEPFLLFAPGIIRTGLQID